MLVAKLSISKVFFNLSFVVLHAVFVAPADKHRHQLHTPVQTILGLCNMGSKYSVEKGTNILFCHVPSFSCILTWIKCHFLLQIWIYVERLTFLFVGGLQIRSNNKYFEKFLCVCVCVKLLVFWCSVKWRQALQTNHHEGVTPNEDEEEISPYKHAVFMSSCPN